MIKSLFKQKLFWGGFVGILLAVFIFTFAFMGSTVNPTLKEMPLAVVVQDEGVPLPNGQQINFGRILKDQIKQSENQSADWTFLNSRDEAVEAMNEKKYYATIVLPSDLSQNIFSLLKENPKKAEVEVLINEGMSLTGANLAGQITNGILSNLNQKVQQNLYEQVGTQQKTLSIDQSKLLAQPVHVTTEKLNKIASHTANGNAPALFTQILWLTTFISSMIIFTIIKKLGSGKWNFTSIVSQLLAGLIFVTTICSLVFWLTNGVLNVSIPNGGEMFLLLLFMGIMFFFIQSGLLNWLGYAAAPLFVLLFFFSMPILTLPPELLPDVTKVWLYSWVPFRFSVEVFRNSLFFEGNTVANGIRIVGYTGLAGLTLMLSAMLKPKKKGEKQQSVIEG
ncbi:YhgE/Pip domain-containing protein [Alkalihalobacillus sp. AL-G]|uniref:YhgE/Pip domain-containing protein n=1 Tax=Alkalihalobacillus sp. AL-G TaxID=2926399 RepID=UPI00272CABF0|nr:YhgE/Pip family protein [Alkalihalobacillus sp. AL-G]WLD94370.1 YhgE/Pip family protein [Alkalihalobacillus sp. AL-G]